MKRKVAVLRHTNNENVNNVLVFKLENILILYY